MLPSHDPTAASGLALLFETYRGDLLRFLTARTGSRDDAEDLLQDLWLKVAALDTGPLANGRAYLYRIAHNLVLDTNRARHRAMRRDRAWLDEDGVVAAIPEDRVDSSESADDSLARSQEAEALRSAIAELPEGARCALKLYRFDGLGQSEIASKLGISRSGVEKHLALAMKRLREKLGDCGYFEVAALETHGATRAGTASRESGQ